MAKKSQKRPVRYEKDHFGCMWGLMNIFDFRHGRSTQRLLSDRRRSGRPAVGAGSPINKLHMLTWNDNCEGNFDGEDETSAAVADGGKPSVKSLIEEEMISEQDAKEINNAEVKPKVSDSEQGNRRKKSRKRMKKAQKKSCDNIHDLNAPESVISEESCHHISEHQSTGSLDIENVMEELSHQICQKGVTCADHDQPDELHVQSNQKNPDFDEKLSEAIKLLIGQKLIKGKNLSEDGEIHFSNELQDALQILGSDGELFLKRLKDPNSFLLKSIQKFLDAQLEKDEDTKPIAGSNMSEQEVSNYGHSGELVNHKQRRFFQKKVKSQERNLLNGNKGSQTSNRIVILKPRPTSLQSLESERSIGASPEPQYSVRNKGLNERIGSHFFLSEIKRKLKNAMGKEHLRIRSDGIPIELAYERQNSGDRDRGIKENVGISSPSKDHFFIERIGRPVGVKKGEKIGKLKDCNLDTEERSTNLPKQRVSNIYIEAKKHLSEMLNNGDEYTDPSRRVPKTLGRILSLPEYNFSPVGSPGRNWEPSFVTAQMRFLDSDTSREVNESTSSLEQDRHVSHLTETTISLETEPCISDGITDDKVQATNFDSNSSVKQFHDDEVGKTSLFIRDEVVSKDNVEIVNTNGAVVQEKGSVLDAPCEPSSSFGIKDDDQNLDVSDIVDGQSYCSNIEQEQSVDDQLPSTPSAFPSISSTTKKVEDQGSSIDILERPSPVSVLEPLFAEEDISPASIRTRSAEVPVQPLRIQFEECDSATEDQNVQLKSSMEDKKSILEYVKTVLQTSGLIWDELFIKSLSSDQLLDPSLCEQIEFFPSQLCYEHKLLFDCINEVLMEVCGHYFGCMPSVSFAKPYIRPVPNMQNALHEIWKGILWHLIPPPLPHTLDQTVRKDMAKSASWMDLRCDTDGIGTEVSEEILEELMEDTILSLVKESPESGCLEILAVR